MDVWEFLAHSEWPAVVSGGLYAFHEELRHILRNVHLKKLKVGEGEAEFEDDIARADKLSKNQNASLDASLFSTSDIKATLSVVGSTSDTSAAGDLLPGTSYFPPTYIPAAQVTSAWMSLLAYMKSLYDRDGSSHSPRRLKWREPEPIQDLASELGLTPSEVGALTEMEALNYRIQRAPTPFVTAREARRYEAVIKRLQSKMKLPEPS